MNAGHHERAIELLRAVLGNFKARPYVMTQEEKDWLEADQALRAQGEALKPGDEVASPTTPAATAKVEQAQESQDVCSSCFAGPGQAHDMDCNGNAHYAKASSGEAAGDRVTHIEALTVVRAVPAGDTLWRERVALLWRYIDQQSANSNALKYWSTRARQLEQSLQTERAYKNGSKAKQEAAEREAVDLRKERDRLRTENSELRNRYHEVTTSYEAACAEEERKLTEAQAQLALAESRLTEAERLANSWWVESIKNDTIIREAGVWQRCADELRDVLAKRAPEPVGGEPTRSPAPPDPFAGQRGAGALTDSLREFADPTPSDAKEGGETDG